MSDWYKPRDEKIGKHKAIKHRITGELALVGKYGEIWQVSDTHCVALIRSSRVAKKYLPEAYHPVQAGDETRWRFPISELAEWIKRLKITKNREGMIRMASWDDFAES
jgi:hypothetical protein